MRRDIGRAPFDDEVPLLAEIGTEVRFRVLDSARLFTWAGGGDVRLILAVGVRAVLGTEAVAAPAYPVRYTPRVYPGFEYPPVCGLPDCSVLQERGGP